MNKKTYNGYTLLELLIAMSITLIATMAIARFFISEHHIYSVQEAEAEMNQTLRGTIDMLTRELILAGYGLPPEMDRITRFDTEEIEFRTNLRNISSSLEAEAFPGQNVFNVKDGTGIFFERGDVIIICKTDNPGKCEKHILTEDGSLDSIKVTKGLYNIFPEGSRIDLINTISYRYSKSRGELQRRIDSGNWAVVAGNIADDGFTISYRDGNNNAPVDSSDIYGIDMTLTVESFRRDVYFQENNGYRRASVSSTITLRN